MTRTQLLVKLEALVLRCDAAAEKAGIPEEAVRLSAKADAYARAYLLATKLKEKS